MTLSDISSDSQPSIAEIITELGSFPGVRKFEYDPKSGFLHAEVDNKDNIHPYELVQKIEDYGISPDGLFLFFPEFPPLTNYTQHFRYNAKMKSFEHSNGNEVDAAKIKMAA